MKTHVINLYIGILMNYIGVMKALAFLGAMATGISMLMAKQYQEGFAVIAAALTSANALSKGQSDQPQPAAAQATPVLPSNVLHPACVECGNRGQIDQPEPVKAPSKASKWALWAAVGLAVVVGMGNLPLGAGLLMSALSSEDAPLRSVELLLASGHGRV